MELCSAEKRIDFCWPYTSVILVQTCIKSVPPETRSVTVDVDRSSGTNISQVDWQRYQTPEQTFSVDDYQLSPEDDQRINQNVECSFQNHLNSGRKRVFIHTVLPQTF